MEDDNRKPLEWFLARIGQTVLRNGRVRLIPDEDWARHFYEVQGECEVFDERL